MRKLIAMVLIGFVFLMINGCAIMPEPKTPYVYGRNLEAEDTLMLEEGEQQIARGEPKTFLDWIGHNIVSLPSKLMLWNWNVANHNISPETEDALKQYLADNDLHNVKVHLNDYVPGEQWHRLFTNESVDPVYKYTLGVFSVAIYTILPERFFAGLIGGDHYNPFTNTINLYSDHPAIALHEAGHAKDFAGQENKGSYAAMRLLPIVPLIQESEATSDTLGYLIDKNELQDEKKAYEILHPAYGSYVFGAGLFGATYDYIPIDAGIKLAANIAGVTLGHISGRDKSSKIEESTESAQLTQKNDNVINK